MILIDSSNMTKPENQQKFLDSVFNDYLLMLENAKAKSYPQFTKLLNYLSDVNGDIDKDKLKNLIIGDINVLKDAIDKVDKLTKEDLKSCPGSDLSTLYGKFTRRIGKDEWPTIIGIDTCPYCNRSYVYTVRGKNVRPDYDHFFPKSIYEYLCVSMFNLVPSCKQCNQLKKDDLKEIIYPFAEEFGSIGHFQIDYSKLKSFMDFLNPSEEVTIQLKIENGPLHDKIVNSNEKFRLEDLYKMHKDYTKDIILLNQIYSDEFLDNLIKTYPWLSEYNTKDLLFINRLNPDEFGKRTLSKFTYDILKQLNGE
mgnify:CR=1 FL=1